MYETAEDLQRLDELLDASYARAGSHLRAIWGPETRLAAGELSEALAGIQVLDLATVTPRGEPRVAPVDGGFADYPRELYAFDWDAAHPHAPYARIDATTTLAFRRS